VCDRVGILRAGRLVDEGTLQQLRRLHTQTIDVTFGRDAPEIAGIDHLDHVVVTPLGPNAIRFVVSGTVGPLLARLADFDVVSIEAREPSLEEVFLHHYGRGDDNSQ
jgi:ABC-2 type transport system ATP-binding protein